MTLDLIIYKIMGFFSVNFTLPSRDNYLLSCFMFEQSQWKTGKRRAEKDDILGAAYLQTIEHPDVSIEIGQA